jgi:hypothetical protein
MKGVTLPSEKSPVELEIGDGSILEVVFPALGQLQLTISPPPLSDAEAIFLKVRYKSELPIRFRMKKVINFAILELKCKD